VKEDHAKSIFGCQFHLNLKDGEPVILATVGSNRVTIYECTSDGALKLLQVFADPDVCLIIIGSLRCCISSPFMGFFDSCVGG